MASKKSGNKNIKNKKTKKNVGNSRKAVSNSSSKKKVNNVEEADSRLQREVQVLIMLAVSLVLFVGILPKNHGFLSFVSRFIFGLFGIMGYVFPLVLFLVFAFVKVNINNSKMKIKASCMVILYIFFDTLIQFIYVGGSNGFTTEYYTLAADDRTGGGLVGSFILACLNKVFGKYASLVVIIAVIVISMVIITEKSLISGVKRGSAGVFNSTKRQIETRKEEFNRKAKDKPELGGRPAFDTESIKKDLFKDVDLAPKSIPVNAKEPVKTFKPEIKNQPLNNKRSNPVNFGKQEAVRKSEAVKTWEPVKNSEPVKISETAKKAEPLKNEEASDKKISNPLENYIPPLKKTGKSNRGPAENSRDCETEVLISKPQQGEIKEEERVFATEEEKNRKVTINLNESGAGYEEGPEETLEINREIEEPEILRKTVKEEVSSTDERDNIRDIINRVDKSLETTVEKKGMKEIVVEPKVTEIPEEKVTEMEIPEDKVPEAETAEIRTSEFKVPEKETFNAERPKALETEFTKTDNSEVKIPESGFSENKVNDTLKVEDRPVISHQSSEDSKIGGLPKYEPSKDKKSDYSIPPLELLKAGAAEYKVDEYKIMQTQQKLKETLDSFGVSVTMTGVSVGPTVTRYEMQPAPGVKVSKIQNLIDDIKLALAAAELRIEAPIPGKSAVGIEVPNKEISTVMLRTLFEDRNFIESKANIPFAVGKDLSNRTIVEDVAKMPHLLIAGATGSGKSVCINTLIMSILYKATPEEVKMIMIDPKVVELNVYNGIPHLLTPIVTDPRKAAGALNWAVMEMEKRYNLFAETKVRDLKGYNKYIENELKNLEKEKFNMDEFAYNEKKKELKKLPKIVIIVDELADLMMVSAKEAEEAICRLAQLARAAGMHLILATQRPSVNVITGLIKANMPSRIAFSVTSGVDSRTILDMNGAEKLLGKGDMLFAPQWLQKPVRLQGAFVSDSEVEHVTEYLRAQVKKDELDSESIEDEIINAMNAANVVGTEAEAAEVDELFCNAGNVIIERDRASIGMLQRTLKIGFNRAARIMDQLADAGVVGPDEGTKPRTILMSAEEFNNYAEKNNL